MADDEKETENAGASDDDKRNALKGLIKEVFSEVIAEHAPAKNKRAPPAPSIWDSFFGGK